MVDSTKLRVGRESTSALFCCRCLLSGIRAEEAVPIWGMAKGNEEWQDYESVSKPLLSRGQISSMHISFSIANDKVKSHIRGLGKCIKYLKSIVQSITTPILYLRHIPYSFTPASNFTFLSLEFTSSGKPFPRHPQTRSHPLLSVVTGLALFHSMWHNCDELFMQYLISDFPPRLQVL